MSRFLVVLALVPFALADIATAKPFKEMFPDAAFENQEARAFVEGLDYKQGTVAIGTGNVRLEVPEGFYFLGKDDARKVVTDAWGNPPEAASDTLGMILPAGKTPVDDTWGAVISYEEEGYVSDEDAGKMDYTELLRSMQEGSQSGNEERVKQGFPAITLVGWASPPYYDKASHKLHWAKELKFGDDPNHTLNYDVRALGRKGVLNIKFVSGMSELDGIKQVIPAVMAMPNFDTGSRYEDFVPGADTVAAYGIGGLIAGKVLAKAGFFALALAFLKQGFILIPLVIAGLWGAFRRFFSKGKAE